MHVLLGRKGLKDIHNPFGVEDVMANVVRIEGNARREERVSEEVALYAKNRDYILENILQNHVFDKRSKVENLAFLYE